MPIETVAPAAPTAPPAAAAPAAGRALTPRAILLGLGLALPLAWLTPWNDWQLNNTYFFNDYLPPIIVVAALAIAVVVNPLLGRRRLARGELVVVVALV